MRNRLPAVIVLATLLTAIGGCTYHLQGVVMESPGGPATVDVVGSGDARLKESGLRYATIELTVDPDAMKPNYMSPVRTDSHGHFSIPISETGAGLLMYKVEIVARAEGFQPAVETIELPNGFQRVVIMLSPGRDNFKRSRDLLDDTLRMERDLRKQE